MKKETIITICNEHTGTYLVTTNKGIMRAIYLFNLNDWACEFGGTVAQLLRTNGKVMAFEAPYNDLITVYKGDMSYEWGEA